MSHKGKNPDEKQHIEIPPITLKWSEWTTWSRFKLDARTDPNAVQVPNLPGVYEVKLIDHEKRLTIGKASNLRMRVKQGLVKGNTPHSSGKKIRKEEDHSAIVIRWAVTKRPSTVEEELHKKHIDFFGGLPKYTQRT
ncbi:MAG: hypothetical protein GY805_05285 [Chloroflexi bacterium]|nr:hypothetical protein [Chloroflexota bacterium]